MALIVEGTLFAPIKDQGSSVLKDINFFRYIYFYFMGVVACLGVVCVPCVHWGLTEIRTAHLNPWNWSYRLRDDR